MAEETTTITVTELVAALRRRGAEAAAAGDYDTAAAFACAGWGDLGVTDDELEPTKVPTWRIVAPEPPPPNAP
jgi:hypothetical protein